MSARSVARVCSWRRAVNILHSASRVESAVVALVVDAMPELGITRVSRWTCNCYVLHNGDGDGAVVVDAGLPAVADDLAPVLKRLEGQVQSIVATHGHSDHVAG